VLLIVLFAILIPLTLITGWARLTLLDTDRYVDTVAELADDSAIQNAVAATASQIIDTKLQSIAAETGHTPPDTQVIDEAVNDVVTSDEFASIWEAANRVAHTQVTAVLKGEKTAGLETSGGRVAIDLAAVFTAISARLTAMGQDVDLETALAGAPESLTIFESDELDSTQQVVRLFDTVVWFLPFVCLAILIAAIIVAPRRWRAVRRAGIALVIAMAVTLALLVLGRSLYLDALGGDVPKDAAEALFDVVTMPLRNGLLVAMAAGIVALFAGVVAERRVRNRQQMGGAA
jgi:hypothetical protein